MKSKKKWKSPLLGFLVATGLSITGLVLFAFWPSGTGHPPGAPGSTGPSGPQAGKSGEKGKTLEEVKKELQDKAFQQQKSKEWVLAEQGMTDLVLKIYQELNASGSRLTEERVRILNTLARNIKPRAQWPKAFNDAKAVQLADFFSRQLHAEKIAGAIQVSSIRNLAVLGQAIPELKSRAEREILEFYGRDERPGPRGECVQSLAMLQSPAGMRVVLRSTQSSDPALAKSGIYALGSLLASTDGTPAENPGADPKLQKQAREGLASAAKDNPLMRPLAVKILANTGDQAAARFVPQLLKNKDNPADIEAAAFAVMKLKLKAYRDQLIPLLQSSNPYIASQVDQALKAIQ